MIGKSFNRQGVNDIDIFTQDFGLDPTRGRIFTYKSLLQPFFQAIQHFFHLFIFRMFQKIVP